MERIFSDHKETVFFLTAFYSYTIWAILVKQEVFGSLLLTVLWDEKSAKVIEINLQSNTITYPDDFNENRTYSK